ncbi:MAG: uracil-xanthine permease family protein [Methylovirgula sp.]
MKKPASLVYGAEEKPPIPIIVVSAVQHVAVIAIFMIYPLIIARQAGAPAAEIAAILRVGALALAVAVVLQALPRGPVGSRFLAPSIFTGIYLGPSLLAVKLGGLPLVWGMTIFAGFVEIGLSRVWSRLRAFIPPETAGMVVFLVGVIIGLAALHVLLGKSSGNMVAGRDALVAGVSIATMISLNIWNKGRLRLFCILIGMVVGYGLSGFTGQITGTDLRAIVYQPVLALPSFSHLSWAFDWSMVIPFAVSGLAAAMSTTAVVTTYQRLTDADWVRPDARSIAGGILGDGIAAVVAGLLGTYGLTVSTANVGLVAATGVASRYIAFAIAAVLAVAAFQPTLIGILTIMPPPVMAAALLFTAVFIMISGVQIISTRVLDPRRTLVIGAGMMAFFMVSVVPSAFAGVPHWVQPLVTSPLVIATLVALSLNLVFRLGIRRTVNLTIDPEAVVLQDVVNFIERAAGVWGARRDVVTRVEYAVQQAVEAIVEFCRIKGPIVLAVSYDEFDINAKLTYEGLAMELPQWAPSHEDMLESEDGPRRLAGFLVRRQADHVQNIATHGATVLSLQFKH